MSRLCRFTRRYPVLLAAVTSFWNYVKDDLGSTLFQTRVYPCMYYHPLFNGAESTACTAPSSPRGGGGSWCDTDTPDDSAVCHEPDPVPAGETCVNDKTILIGDIPYQRGSNGLSIRQVRTKSVSKSFRGRPPISVYPPFELDNEDDATWGIHGRQWHDQYPTVTKYLPPLTYAHATQPIAQPNPAPHTCPTHRCTSPDQCVPVMPCARVPTCPPRSSPTK